MIWNLLWTSMATLISTVVLTATEKLLGESYGDNKIGIRLMIAVMALVSSIIYRLSSVSLLVLIVLKYILKMNI